MPLAEALAARRDLETKLRAAQGAAAGPLDAIIVADQTTSYRLFYEVLYTLEASGFGRIHLMVVSAGRK